VDLVSGAAAGVNKTYLNTSSSTWHFNKILHVAEVSGGRVPGVVYKLFLYNHLQQLATATSATNQPATSNGKTGSASMNVEKLYPIKSNIDFYKI